MNQLYDSIYYTINCITCFVCLYYTFVYHNNYYRSREENKEINMYVTHQHDGVVLEAATDF